MVVEERGNSGIGNHYKCDAAVLSPQKYRTPEIFCLDSEAIIDLKMPHL